MFNFLKSKPKPDETQSFYESTCINITKNRTNRKNRTNITNKGQTRKFEDIEEIGDYFNINEEKFSKGKSSIAIKGKLKSIEEFKLQQRNKEDIKIYKKISIALLPSNYEYIAIKKMPIDQYFRDETQLDNKNELMILEKLKLRKLNYVCEYYCCLYNDRFIWMIMELGIDLENYIKNYINIINYNLLSISQKLALAIKNLHNQNIIHNDIKLKNIIVITKLDNNIIYEDSIQEINDKNEKLENINLEIKFIDFGLSCNLDQPHFRLCNVEYYFGSDDYLSNNITKKPPDMNAKFKNNRNTTKLLQNTEKLQKKDWYAFIIILFVLNNKTNIVFDNNNNKKFNFHSLYPHV